MNKTKFPLSRLAHSICIFGALAFFSSASVWAAKGESFNAALASDEDTFVFTGTCDSGEPYRLYAYQKIANGESRSFYDYEGPVGKGTVQSNTVPKVLAARVCRRFAEIINTHYWE